jgi:hypothetical protein
MKSIYNTEPITTIRRIVLLSLLLLPFVSKAQFTGDLQKGDYFKSDYHDEKGNKISISIFNKGRTNEVERKDSVIEYTDGSKFESKIHFLAGDTNLLFQYYHDASKQLRFTREKHFDNNGKPDSDKTEWLSPNGTPIKKRTLDPTTKQYKMTVLREGKWVETDTPPFPAAGNDYIAVRNAGGRRSSTPQMELALGYSYLRADNGSSGLGLPLGLELSGVYNLNRKLGAVLDVSYHSGEKNDQHYDREYIMAGIEYDCDDCCCDDGPTIFTRALIGYGRDGFKFMNFKNSNSGLIASVGTGVNVRVNPKTFIQLKTDAIGTFFNDDMQIDYRIGLGVGVNLGHRTSSLRKNPNINLKRF